MPFPVNRSRIKQPRRSGLWLTEVGRRGFPYGYPGIGRVPAQRKLTRLREEYEYPDRGNFDNVPIRCRMHTPRDGCLPSLRQRGGVTCGDGGQRLPGRFRRSPNGSMTAPERRSQILKLQFLLSARVETWF